MTLTLAFAFGCGAGVGVTVSYWTLTSVRDFVLGIFDKPEGGA